MRGQRSGGVTAQHVAHPEQTVIAGRERIQLRQPSQDLTHRADPSAEQIRPTELVHRVGIVRVGGAGLCQQPDRLSRVAAPVGNLAHDGEALRRIRIQLEGAAGTISASLNAVSASPPSRTVGDQAYTVPSIP